MENKDIIEYLEPVWEDSFTAIAMSSSEEYLPYLSVCLQSLIENTSAKNNYDIIIFSSAPKSEFYQLIIDTYTRNNVSIRFYNPKDFLKDTKLQITHHYFNEACYYRITSPIVLKKYKKVIFSDIDLIFNNDINMLSDLDMSDAPIAACKEPLWECFIDNNVSIKGIDIKNYSQDVLKLSDIKKYYNTGVMVINIKEFLDNNYFEKLKDAINGNFFLYQEQCAINFILNDKILPLDSSWNFEINERIANAYVYDKEKVNIIHFLGGNKPWFYPETRLSNLWWNYARRTPFYEIILKRMTDNTIKANNGNLINFKKNILEYWRYKILSNITFGKKREYLCKKKYYKDIIRATYKKR